MKGRIVFVHLAILVAYCSLIFLMSHQGGEALYGRAILSLIAVGVHVLFLAVRAIAERSGAHLLSAVLVLLVGWSFCTSSFTL